MVVRKGIVAFFAWATASAAGCAEVVVEDPPSTLDSDSPDTASTMSTPNAGAMSGPPVVAGGMPTVPAGGERPTPLPQNPNGGNPAPGASNPGSPIPSGMGGAGMAPSVPLGPSGELLLSDDFEDGNDEGWIPDVADGDDLLGAWAIVQSETGSMVYAQTDDSFDDDSWSVGGNREWTDVSFEARFRFTAVREMEDAIVMAAVRFQSKESYVYLQYGGDGTVKIRSEIDGDSELASAETERVAEIGQWITLRVVAQGSTVTAFVDDVMTATGSLEGALPSGRIALGVRENSAVEFDDVHVTIP